MVVGVSGAAAMAGVSRQTAHKWLARARRGEPMADRGCRPRRLAGLLLASLALATETGVPARTCARIVARRGLPRLDDVDRVTGEPRARGPVTRVRYERERPGAAPRRRQEGAAHTRGGRARGPRARLRVEEGRRDVVPARVFSFNKK